MTTASLNFTSRSKIKSKLVSIHIIERADSFIRVRVSVDGNIGGGDKEHQLVIDAFERGRHQRRVITNPAGENIDFNDFPINASLRFKVRKIAIGAEKGKVIAATADLRPVDNTDIAGREPFLVPELDDLGSLPWEIKWEDDCANPRIILNRRLLDKFETWRDPNLQALYLPSMLRDLLTGIICRNDDVESLDEDTLAKRIVDFCTSTLDIKRPACAFADNMEDWLEWTEACVHEFAARKWRDDKTLFDQMRDART